MTERVEKLDDATQKAIAAEVALAEESARGMDEDAKEKGIFLDLTGARYRIYETDVQQA